ncbi:hypothetical protein [Clostridium sp.]|jgi:hypothetical protein|uniref:hypothetical protein n=1 Tax=Clostridium sp. TaxID=1506 RepID=UPI0039A020B4
MIKKIQIKNINFIIRLSIYDVVSVILIIVCIFSTINKISKLVLFAIAIILDFISRYKNKENN